MCSCSDLPDMFKEGKNDFDKLKQVLGEYVNDEKGRYNFIGTARVRL